MIIILDFRITMSLSELKAPQNPLSAYAYFFKETQNSIKSQQPNATFESVSKIVETMWQALEEDQKEKYRWVKNGELGVLVARYFEFLGVIM